MVMGESLRAICSVDEGHPSKLATIFLGVFESSSGFGRDKDINGTVVLCSLTHHVCVKCEGRYKTDCPTEVKAVLK